MTLKSAAQKAVLSNPEVLARYNAFLASEGELTAVTSAMLPHLDYIASKGKEDLNQPTIKGKFTENSQTLELSQLLWDGLSSWNQKRQFDHARLVRLYEFFDASEIAALEVGRAYFDVLRYRKLIALAEDNYVQHRSVYEQIEARVKAGVGRRVDFEQATGRLALSESNLLVEIANLHDVSARFQRLVGEPPAKDLEEPPPYATGTPPTVHDALIQAYSENAQIRAAVENVRAAEYARDSRRGVYSPNLRFRLRENRGDDISGIKGSTNNHIAEVILNFNIFNGLGDMGRVDQANGLYNTARDQRDKACRDVRQTLEIAFNDVRKLTEQRNYLEQHRQSVEKARDAYRKQFDIGQRSLLDLLDTENELFQARRALVNADLDLLTAYIRVHASRGRLLNELGLSSIDHAALKDETKDWSLGEETPSQCPPDAVDTFVTNKDQLNERAAEMTREKVKVMLDAIAARAAGQAGDATKGVTITTAPITAPSAEKAISEALNQWALAWRAGDIKNYLAAYSPTFVPKGGKSRESWARKRTAVIGSAKEIKITLSNQKVIQRDATHASTQFHQSYASSTYADEMEKNIDWELTGGRWLIIDESPLALPPAAPATSETPKVD